jgi:bifunctional non-homologous end joining protein LigD
MNSRFIVHHHKTGRSHYDLRLIQDGVLRCWSLLRQPPQEKGERRLAIERESFSPQAIDSPGFMESAFGRGRVYTWDDGEVDIKVQPGGFLALIFRGKKLLGRYELRRMRWYPGNHWILKKTAVLEAQFPDENAGRQPVG